jgi:hypothetical protein
MSRRNSSLIGGATCNSPNGEVFAKMLRGGQDLVSASLYFKPNCGRKFFERFANKNETATGKNSDDEKASQGGNGFTLRAGDQWWLIEHQVCTV